MHTLKEIKRLGSDGVRLTWSDGTCHEISSRVLRENCPSAISQAKRGDTSHEKPLSGKSALLRVVESSADEELCLEEIWAVGNYAIGMKWADGHDSGIYTFEFLYELGSAVMPEGASDGCS